MECNKEEILKQCKILKEEIDGLKQWELYDIDCNKIYNSIKKIAKEARKKKQ